MMHRHLTALLLATVLALPPLAALAQIGSPPATANSLGLKDATGSYYTLGSGLFAAYATQTTTTANTTINVADITVASAANIAIGDSVWAAFVANGTYVTNIVGTTVTMSANATASGTGTAVSFGQNRFVVGNTTLTDALGAKVGYFGSASQGRSTWLNRYYVGSDFLSSQSLLSISPSGSYAGIFATRSSDQTGGAGASVIPLAVEVVQDGTGTAHSSWAQYLQADLLASSTPAEHINNESSIQNGWATSADSDPYTANPARSVFNLRLDNGKGAGASNTATAALDIINNGGNYRAGIIIGSDALDTSSGRIAPALAMGPSHSIDWYSAAGNQAWRLYSTATSGNRTMILGPLGVAVSDQTAANPATQFSIISSTGTTRPSTNVASMMNVTNTNGAAGTGAQIGLGNIDGNPYATIGTALADGANSGAGDLVFVLRNGSAGTMNEKFRMRYVNGGFTFGGATASFPALYPSGSTLQVRLADNSADAPLTALTFNKVTVTPPATGATLTIADGKTATHSSTTTFAGVDGKTLTVNNSLTLAGTDTTTMTFPSTSKTLMASDYSNGTTLTANAILTGGGAAAAPNAVAITGLVKGNGASAPAAYGGTSCTNQFPRSLDLNGAATCASVANADLAGSIAAAKLVGTDIATVGTLTTGSAGAGFTLTDTINQEFEVGTATLTKTTDTALATVTGLSQALTAGKTYNCRGHLTGTAGASGGIKVALVATASLSATQTTWTGFTWNGTTAVSNTTVTALGSNIAAATAVYSDVYIDGSIVVNAGGTINVQAAQNASNSTATTVLQGSTFSCVRVN